MKTEQLMIVKKELDLLKKHLKDSNLSEYNKNQLLAELGSAKIVKEDELPEDAVCIGSEVEIQEVVSERKYTFQIVLPAEANMKENKMSVFAPIGTALLGYRVGAQVQWEMPNGMKTFDILKVSHKRI
ncbi:regulator of nucleoside diphosphate kinase [Pedobacter cryoconitis]|uniref:Regulator of nucleoside diphosphate kinase n=1 Tax=Pedobacter cryoconitis TaxID=188932 RepID=A0A7W9DX73_9SPHI|nr:GreA/GreB family elongation factor [Pedobacter cryoconitis]MBB5634568.1 regulator of nucleoside diphosphate kinase [Pedobacter cryoconitis]MBB6272302.1 regulator of nucleoside diphosphate kinase [Pedobacter cryoconitis]